MIQRKCARCRKVFDCWPTVAKRKNVFCEPCRPEAQRDRDKRRSAEGPRKIPADCERCGQKIERTHACDRSPWCVPCRKERKRERDRVNLRSWRDSNRPEARRHRGTEAKIEVGELQERECLRCGQVFPSTGIGHRICGGCTQLNTRIQKVPAHWLEAGG